MDFRMFYSCLSVLATVASAPVDNYWTIGTGSDNTLCDFSKGDCSLFHDNGYTISSADSSAFPDGAGVEGPSAFLNLVTTADSDSLEEGGFVTKSDFTPDLIEPWIASGLSSFEIAGNPQSNTATAPVRSSVTYDCENPFQFNGGDPNVDVSSSSPVKKKPSNGEKLPSEGSDPINCTKCRGPNESAFGTALYTLLLSPFRGQAGAPSIKDHVKLAAIRSLLEYTTIPQSQIIAPPVDKLYADFAKEKGFKPETLVLSNGTEAYWIGSKNAEKVIVWFHGGGFSLPAGPGHFSFGAEIVDAASSGVALLLATYDLAPHATYPRQLTQGVEIVRHLVTVLQRKPSSIILAGDSAGGHLTLGILSHILHPHPKIPPLLPLSTPFRAIVLLTPWAAFSPTPSFEKYKNRDVINGTHANKWSQAFLGNAPPDPYNEPLTAEAEWWRDVPAEEVLIVASTTECLTDTVKAMGDKLKSEERV
ncbi:hypothetical protein MMC29_000683 [Sticta canariensis]|nr:hypothetical protein [Sticta canariensis]